LNNIHFKFLERNRPCIFRTVRNLSISFVAANLNELLFSVEVYCRYTTEEKNERFQVRGLLKKTAIAEQKNRTKTHQCCGGGANGQTKRLFVSGRDYSCGVSISPTKPKEITVTDFFNRTVFCAPASLSLFKQWRLYKIEAKFIILELHKFV